MIKRLVLYAIIVIGFSSCAAMQKGDFLKHDSMYKNWDHMVFSIMGSNDLATTHEQSVAEGWWGIPQKVE